MQEAAEHRKTQKDINAEKTAFVAKELYPKEKWEFLEEGIYIAKSRQPKSARQFTIFEEELRQARLLVARESAVYFLPESENPKIKNKKYPDAVVNGIIMEFKTISGNERKIKEQYKDGREKAENVFLYIEPSFSQKLVVSKLRGTIKGKGYQTGLIWIYYSQNGNFTSLSVQDLLQKKSGSRDPAGSPRDGGFEPKVRTPMPPII